MRRSRGLPDIIVAAALGSQAPRGGGRTAATLPRPDGGGSVPVVPTARFARAVWPFGLALVIAAVTRLAFPFDGLFGQDAFAYFRFARAIGPHLIHGAPLPPLFWPRGYPAAVAAFLPLTGGGPFAGQLVSALACAWTAAATFLLVRELDGGRGAADPIASIVAGLCVAASGVVLRESQVVMA